MKPPLQVALLFQTESPAAALAAGLFASLAAGPDDAGLRIPMPFHAASDGAPLPLAIDAAEHTLAVVLVDSRMARRVGPDAAGAAWAALVCKLLAESPPGTGPHAVLPVALDASAFSLDEARLGGTSFLRLDVVPRDEQAERLLFHVCAASLRLLDGRPVAPGATAKAPVSLFISHAKPDLPKDTGLSDTDPVRSILLELSQTPVDAWFDAKKIPRGGKFPEEISGGVLQCSALIAVVTNHWSSREWCRREVLEAKEARRPMLVVDHITDEKPRLFPYLGNAPVMRWKNHLSARKAVTFAVREALRYRFHMAALSARAAAGDEVFGTKPELLSVAQLPSGTRRVLYPDPPLGEEELRELRRVATGVVLTTPLTLVASFRPPPGRNRIALSLSTAQDAARYGGSPEHLALLAHDLNLFLMLAGFSIAYGGTLVPEGVLEDEANFTERLFSVARSYSPIAQQLGQGERMGVIRNYVGWPIHSRYGEREYDQYPTLAELIAMPRPTIPGVAAAELAAVGAEWFPPDTAARRFAWARGMTGMREAMRDAPDIAGRIVLGGKLTGYVGRYPGVLEEALLDLRKGRPVFLVGTLGGAARLVYDSLRGEPREELTTAWVAGSKVDGQPRVPFYDAVRRLHLDGGLEMKTPEELATELGGIAKGGLGAALRNGLDDAKNHELATSTDPHRIVELVILGLQRLAGTTT